MITAVRFAARIQYLRPAIEFMMLTAAQSFRDVDIAWALLALEPHFLTYD